MDNGPPKQQQALKPEALPIFQEGIYLILSRWSALQIAVDNEFGGRQSAQLANQLASDIFSWFTQPKGEPLYIDDLEYILEEGMTALNTECQDGSIEEVAEKLMIVHEECLDSNYSSIEKLRTAGPSTAAHQHIRQVVDDEDEDDDDDDGDDVADNRTNMMGNAPGLQLNSSPANVPVNEPMANQVQAEDGWEVVSSRRNRGRRN